MPAKIVHQRTGEIVAVFNTYAEAATYRRDVLLPQLDPASPCPFAIRTEDDSPLSSFDPVAVDGSLPVEAVTVTQVAVVFTAIGGPDRGIRTCTTHPRNDVEWLRFWRDQVARRQAEAGMAVDARIMRREVTLGPWQEVDQ